MDQILEAIRRCTGRAVAYYAHCLSIYNTPQEARDLDLIEDLGWYPFNPNDPQIQEKCDAIRAEVGRVMCPVDGEIIELPESRKDVMYDIFRPLVLECDLLVFRALPDGSISSGAVKEINWALEAGKPVVELPSGILRRSLSLDATREYLREVGQR